MTTIQKTPTIEILNTELAVVSDDERSVFAERYNRLLREFEPYGYNTFSPELIEEHVQLFASSKVEGVTVYFAEVRVISEIPQSFLKKYHAQSQTYITCFIFNETLYTMDYELASYCQLMDDEDFSDNDEDDDTVPERHYTRLSKKELIVEFFEFLNDYFNDGSVSHV